MTNQSLMLPEKPEYRALMMYDQLPEGCISFAVTDRYSIPHIRPGEFVVVDTKDTTPREGEVYVIEWVNGRRNICQAHISRLVTKDPNNPLWSVGSLRNIRGRAAIEQWIEQARKVTAATGRIQTFPGWSDGWFPTAYLQSKLIGCVIGLHAPAFEEPKRAA